MKLTFLGAAREVTGSRFLLQAAGKNIMVDYGMEQGVDLYENAKLPIQEKEIDCVLLTHAHCDHSGYLPLLAKRGFTGPVYTTAATADLCRIMLLDSAHIQESDAEYANKKAKRAGKKLVEPLYTTEDATTLCSQIIPLPYNLEKEIFPGVTIRMVDVGHLLGSASIEMKVTEEGQTRVLAFSGDIGNVNQPLLRDPEYLHHADYVVMESTYGDRLHSDVRPDYVKELTSILQETFDRGGNVVIPSFAVGRTQEMLYFIREIKQRGLVTGHDGFPVYVDSPLGIEATHVFNENTLECADEETMALIRSGVNPLTFENLRVSSTADESKLINDDTTPKVILSSSGMCDAGRIRHHLKHNLWRPESTVLFVGYQSVGTLGRSLVDGAREVKLFGEKIAVQAQIRTLAGISGHADQAGLIRWISEFEEKPEKVFVVHGDDEVAALFAQKLQQELGLDACAPYNGEVWELAPAQLVQEGNTKRLKKISSQAAALDAVPKKQPPAPKKASKSNSSYANLVLVGEQIQQLIASMENSGVRTQDKLAKLLRGVLKKYGKK